MKNLIVVSPTTAKNVMKKKVQNKILAINKFKLLNSKYLCINLYKFN